MPLSQRALKFLQKSRRDPLPYTEQELRSIFTDNDAPVFEPLIDFQMRFGGYIFYAGLEPVKFSLVKGAGKFPIVEFDPTDEPEPAWYFDCATTRYQMAFHLDENGIYYEDYKPQASRFEKAVEHLALWDEIDKRYEVLYRNKPLKTESVDKVLNLTLLPEASDQYTLWFRSDFMYMQQWEGLTTLIVSPDYPEKQWLLSL